MKEYAKAFYKSKTWQQCRASYLRSVGGLCERCLSKGLIKPAVMVHHKTYITPDNINDPNVTLNWNNLEALCQGCHTDEHQPGKRRYKVDEYGRVLTR